MKLFSPILLLILLSCRQAIEYPVGGYEYPVKVSDSDTNYYYYPLKDIVPKLWAFGDSYMHVLYERFNEPNLSIRPLTKETFRLTYRSAFDKNIIMILTEGLITVRKGNNEGLYYIDESRLNAIENYHLKILNKWFPIQTSDKSPQDKVFVDYLVKIYRQLNDKNYYRHIYEKQFILTGKKFTYETTKILLSRYEYYTLIKEINLSGFWTLLYLIVCKATIADGEEFTLDANTKTKYQKVTAQTYPNNKSPLSELVRIKVESIFY